jgi:hypothetical protein
VKKQAYCKRTSSIGGNMVNEVNPQGAFTKYSILQVPAVRTKPRGRGSGGIMMLANKQALEFVKQSLSRGYIFAKMRDRKSGTVMIVATLYIPQRTWKDE